MTDDYYLIGFLRLLKVAFGNDKTKYKNKKAIFKKVMYF